MTTSDLTLGRTWKRLHALGYAATSATHPDRIVNDPARKRESFVALAAHPAAIMLHPTPYNGAQELLEDTEQRQVLDLILTSYLLADQRQAKAVTTVLDGVGLLGGPFMTDGYGNRHYPLKWNGWPVMDSEVSARLAFSDDDETVLIRHAIAPGRYQTRGDIFGRQTRHALEPVGSHVLPLDGEWKGGDLLSTSRDRLPELLQADLPRLIADVEAARWGARPAAKAG